MVTVVSVGLLLKLIVPFKLLNGEKSIVVPAKPVSIFMDVILPDVAGNVMLVIELVPEKLITPLKPVNPLAFTDPVIPQLLKFKRVTTVEVVGNIILPIAVLPFKS